MALCLNLLLLVSSGLLGFSVCRVIELDDSFLELRKEGMWLVEFYAPWCGHCKRLEPTYHEVSVELRDSPIKVAKLDCTRYSNVASEFNVRGFPTIMFISGENEFTHKGERSKDDIIEFANRAFGPPVRKIPSIGKFYDIKGKIADSVMFLYVGEDDTEADLFKKYSEVAEKSRIQAYFYSGKRNILPEDVKFKNDPTVLVFKDGDTYEYEAPEGVATLSSLNDWVRSERYNAFPMVLGGNINEMADTGKILVISVVDLNDEENMALNMRVKNIAQTLATKHRERFHSKFQFLWMRDVETVNSITMSFMNAPCIVLLDTETYLYYLINFSIKDITTSKLSQFLDDVGSGKIPAYGGTGFFQRVKRIFYDILTTVLSVWQSSRWLFLLMFGLPTVVISIVCYSLCCMETVDDGVPDSDDEDDEDREIREAMKQGELPSPPTPTPPPTPAKDGHIKAE